MPRDAALSSARNPYVHGLRGLLAFLIFLFHVAHSGLPTISSAVVNYALFSFEYGVDLFFGISGIVIVSAWKKAHGPLDFAADRLTRILPVLWVTVIVIAILGQFQSDKSIPADFITIAANLFALPPLFNFHQIHPAAWSICFEFAFYCLFLLFYLSSQIVGQKAGKIIVLVAGALVVMHQPRALGFLMGILVAGGYLSSIRFPTFLYKHAGVMVMAALLLWRLSTVLLGAETAQATVADLMHNFAALMAFVAAFASGTLGLLFVYAGQGFFCAILNTRILQFMGTISFSFYLWQTIVMAMVKKGMYMLHIPEIAGEYSQLVFFVLSLPPTVLVSYLSCQLLEVRTTRWLRGQYLRFKAA